MNRNSETYQLLATEAVEFLYWCMKDQKLSIKEIQKRYLKKEFACLSYGGLLQQLINDHVKICLRKTASSECIHQAVRVDAVESLSPVQC